MNSWTRMAWGGLIVATMTCCGTASAQTAAPAHAIRHLTVTVYDYSGVEPTTLAYAQGIASEVYRQAGIEIEWADTDDYADASRFAPTT